MTPRKRFTPLLAASLLLNVFLLCGVAGGLYHWRDQQQQEEVLPARPHGLRQVLAQLPEARRHELRRALRQTRADNQALLAQRRMARQAVVHELLAADFDRQALRAELGKARDADSALRVRVDDLLAEFAGNLPLAERQALAQSVYAPQDND
jgi:uncharacterized membrane protein